MSKPSDSNPCGDEPNAPPPSGSKRPYVIGILIAVILILMVLGFIPKYIQREKIEREAAEDPLLVVTVMEAKADTNEIPLVLPSYLDAIHITPIWARTNGYLGKLYTDIGDYVEEGQLLAEIETPEVDQQLNQSRADLLGFIAQEEIALISTNRWQELYKRNPQAISKQEVDERAATYNNAVANVESAAANVKRLEYLSNFKRILAPFDGIIIKRDIDLGSLITQGSNGNPQEMFQIARTDVIRAFVNVPQPFFRFITDGLPAQATIQQYPGKIFRGEVARNARALDPIARTLLTEVHIQNKSRELLVGLYAQIKFMLKPDAQVFIIPIAALIIGSGPPFVALLGEHNVVHMQQVEIGRDFGSSVEIVRGIKENDTIITNPTVRIQEGVTVRVQAKFAINQ